jgi:peptidoglycan hydrolase-like protein with peptidoglycan-binding domain
VRSYAGSQTRVIRLTIFCIAGYLGPEVEARIKAFREKNGPVLFGGRLASNVDKTLAIPDNLGLYLDEPNTSSSNTAEAR